MGFIGNQGFGGISYTNLGTVKGKVADAAALDNVTGMSNGDLYLQEDNGHASIYDGSSWVDLGTIVGPTGATGPVGPAGTIDHITKTSGTVESGATTTYTAYADVDETQVLGTFDVYNGADATIYYTWVKYADDDAGTNMSDDPSGKEYMGIAYNKTTATESTEAADYSWSLIKGTDGTGTVDSVVAGTNVTIDSTDAANPIINVGDTLPAQGDNTGKFLTTDGSAASWAEVVSSEHYDQEDTPTPSSTGATWYVPSTGVIYKYVNDGTSDVWIDISTAGAGVSQTYVDDADALKADKAQDVNTSTVYTDNTTAATYKMYMDNGEIIMEEL